MSVPTVYYGPVINPESLTAYKALPRCLLVVNSAGTIDWVFDDVDSSQVQEVLGSKGIFEADIIELKNGEFLVPGFVDNHTHAPQVPNIGSGQQYELLDWLDNVTFPMESKFADPEFAKAVYPSVVQRFIQSGTTTCCYYGSLHLEATKVLANVVQEAGQRAFVGKCNMNQNCPDHYREPSVEVSVADTKALIAYIRSLKSDLVYPIITPRFAISCTGPLLSALGDLAKVDPSVAIQTHISENQDEIDFTMKLFPECASYADVYDKAGLLNDRMILAHAVHLSESEMQLIKARNAGISHCPTSNFNLRSGMAKVSEMLDRGIKVGLGTDVSGGFSTSILTAIQHASICSKVVAIQSPPPPSTSATPPPFANKQLPVPTLLYLATMGGAEVCNLSHKIGNFTVGKGFDALLVDLKLESGNPELWTTVAELQGTLSQAELKKQLEKFLFCGSEKNIAKVFVQGRGIGGTRLMKA